MTDPQTFVLTVAEWRDDIIHRVTCNSDGCDDRAHSYVDAISQGRVVVDGVVISLDDPRR